MTDGHDKPVMPAKCVHCNRPMSTVVLCDYCERINPLPGGHDHFELLGLARRFEIDPAELHQKYIALSRHAHPDFHAQETQEVQALSQSVSSAVNEAYRTLSDPYRRAGYLLELLGGPSSAEDKSVPEGFLGTMMMMQEELSEAAEGERANVAAVMRTQHDGMLNRIASLFADLESAAGCEATRQDLLHELRKQLNALAYVRKLLSQV